MIKKVSLGLLALALTTSCVSSKVYKELEDKYANLKKENRSISDENEDLTKAKNQLDIEIKDLK
jgi:chemotaxis protein MotB